MNYFFQLNEDGFQKTEYLNYIEKINSGIDKTYVEAAEAAVQLCKDQEDIKDR